jgi:uncharacterized protein (DUF2062 family)
MPRKFLRRVLPSQATIRQQWFLRPFKALLHDPALWATHRRNVLRALALGIFICFIPFPVHTALAAITALYLRVNVPVAILASWISNPLTFGPMYYGAYRLGVVILGSSAEADPAQFSGGELDSPLLDIWPPLLVGCLISGLILALLSYWLLNRLWVWRVRRRFQRRRLRR